MKRKESVGVSMPLPDRRDSDKRDEMLREQAKRWFKEFVGARIEDRLFGLRKENRELEIHMEALAQRFFELIFSTTSTKQSLRIRIEELLSTLITGRAQLLDTGNVKRILVKGDLSLARKIIGEAVSETYAALDGTYGKAILLHPTEDTE